MVMSGLQKNKLKSSNKCSSGLKTGALITTYLLFLFQEEEKKESPKEAKKTPDAKTKTPDSKKRKPSAEEEGAEKKRKKSGGK